MMRRLCILLLSVSLFAASADAQTRRASRKGHGKKKATATTAQPAPTITVDTPDIKPVIVTTTPLPGPDTTKKDSTKIEQVADAVHDSVKAQIKAPIVQVPVTLKSLIVPGILFTYGAVTLNNGSLRIFNKEAQKLVWNGQIYGRPYIEDYMLLFPAAVVYGLNIAGVKGRNNLIDRSVIYGMSNGIANGIIFGIKFVGIEVRPDTSDNHSFPSGHTAEAFVSAEFFHQEYKGRLHWTATAAAYGVAVGVAYLRMYHNKHWLSDVVAGAGVGIASTRFSYYLYPVIKHWLFGSKKVREAAMIYPVYQTGGVYGLGLVYRF